MYLPCSCIWIIRNQRFLMLQGKERQMGKSDTYSKDLMQDNDYFADIVNNVLFQGREFVHPNELRELDPTELTIVEELVEESISIQKYRDVLKQISIREDDKTIYVIIGIENQTDIHYAMPVKNLLYDAIRYAKQVDQKTREYKKKETKGILVPKLTSTEFLSGWRKKDKLQPVITITVYYGTKKWDGPRSLHEMLDDSIKEPVLRLIPDYKLHLLEPAGITNWDTYKSDIGLLFQAIAVSDEKNGINNLVKEKSRKFCHVDNKIVNAINFYTNAKIPINKNEEGKVMDVCYAVKTAEAGNMIETCVGLKHSLEETLEYVLSKFVDDKDITEEYVIAEYNYFFEKKNN